MRFLTKNSKESERFFIYDVQRQAYIDRHTRIYIYTIHREREGIIVSQNRERERNFTVFFLGGRKRINETTRRHGGEQDGRRQSCSIRNQRGERN